MLSALLSRGAEGVRTDMDVRESPLIGGHGYCQQELVTLLLVGRAHSNVFDGVVEMGDDNSLRGIPDVSDCGYLTLFEALSAHNHTDTAYNVAVSTTRMCILVNHM